MNWNTNVIVEDLKRIINGANVKIETEQSPQGERYCRDILITINGDDDGISIIGFDDEIDNLSDVDTPKEEIKLVEVRNYHSDDDGGLSKRASKDIRVIYFKVVDYFNEQDNIEVVDSLGDYF